jgi:hypothetical protein
MRPFSTRKGWLIMAKKKQAESEIVWRRGRYSEKRAKQVIANFNRARTRALRSDKLTEYDKQFIPGKVNFNTLASATSAKDRDRLLDYLAMAKGGVSIFEQQDLNTNVTLSKYQMDVAQNQLARINRQRRKYENELLKAAKKPGNIPDYYKKEVFDPKSYTDQGMLVRRLGDIAVESGADYMSLRRLKYLDNYRKGLERAYGVEEGNRLMNIILHDESMNIRNPKEIERILYENDLDDIDEHYATAKEADEQSAYISRLEEAFSANG